MSNGQQVRPCAFCGNEEFIYLPEVGITLKKVTKWTSQATAPAPTVALLVCTRCSHLEWFAKDWSKIIPQISGATTIRSSS